MNTFYFPVEISTRELTAKVFLANKMASMGGCAFVFRCDLFDRVGWPSSGIYVGKHMFRTEVPHSDVHYKKMKENNILVCHLEEEGGIYPGENINDWEVRLSQRFDPSSLDDEDYIFTWGNWQKKYYINKSIKNVIVTGSPNFDVCQEKYNSFFDSHDLFLTSGLDGFILINTRFALSNSVDGFERFINENSPKSKKMDKNKFAKMIAESGILQYQFARLAMELAEKFPNEKIVLRPHPNEDINFYITLLSRYGNIYIKKEGDIGAWIRRSKLVIHYGCSTAIQADIAGKQIISYQPHFDESNVFSMGIPNKIGMGASSTDEVVSLVRKILKGELKLCSYKEEWNETISVIDSVEKLSSILSDLCRKTSSNESGGFSHIKKKAGNKVRIFEFFENIKSVPRFVFGKRKSHKNAIEYFNLGFFKSAEGLNSIANEIYGNRVTVTSLGRYCYVFENS